MRIFITGDRSIDPGTAVPLVTLVLLKELVPLGIMPGEVTIVTGENGGVEEAVRFVTNVVGLNTEVLHNAVGDNGYTDWDARHDIVDRTCDRALAFHPDVHSSRITKSLLARVAENKVEVIVPELILA